MSEKPSGSACWADRAQALNRIHKGGVSPFIIRDFSLVWMSLDALTDVTNCSVACSSQSLFGCVRYDIGIWLREVRHRNVSHQRTVDNYSPPGGGEPTSNKSGAIPLIAPGEMYCELEHFCLFYFSGASATREASVHASCPRRELCRH